MFEYFKTVVVDKYVDFGGRARRSEYWYFCLTYVLISFAMGFIVGLLGGVAGFPVRGTNYISDTLSVLLSLALFLPSIAVGIRRMHDVDKSGWFCLVPFYNIYLLVKPGTVGPNRYGPDPKAAEGEISMPVPVPPAPPTI